MAPPRTVILLGADAASFLASGARPFRDALRRCDGPAPDSLARAVRDLGASEPGSDDAPDALGFLSLLDLDREHRKGHNRQALEEARRSLIRLGIDAERRAASRGTEAAASLAACLAPGDAVVCLGPEERMEAALVRLSWPASWTPMDGYGLPFRRAQGGTARSTLRVHKLRGSLGWIYCRRCRGLFASSPLGGDGEGAGDHPCLHADDQRDGVVAGRGMRGYPRFALGRVRAAAAAALARADRVVLLGEAPDAGDPFILWVLRRGAAAGRRRAQVVSAGPRAAEEGARLRAALRAEPEGPDLPGVEELASHLGRPGALF